MSDSLTDPITLPYAQNGRQSNWLRRHWRVGAILFCVTSIGVAYVATESGRSSQYDGCSLCGATRIRRSWHLFWTRFNYSYSIQKGALATCIEKHTGQTCPHQWRMSSYSSPYIRATGNGISITMESSRLDHWPQMVEILDKHLKNDASFLSRLRDYLQGNGSTSRAFFDQLCLEADALTKSPAAASKPTP